ncbi:acyltransferase [Microbacterium sp. kSW2-24]|uniref:acyltransferase family protein n=1 Tax=Microbacterium galbinum TaxID=2851646 RepID=UPI001FFC4447|nr:acyltransferase [Microbacterium galbinum]MCK2021545.1 acyltransferase [Microbacterium galbinum]
MAIVQAPPVRDIPSAEARGTRDTGIDLVRSLCVIGVVLLHAIMVGVSVVDGRPAFDNASTGTWWIVPVSWALQVMPLFFVIGGFSGLLAYRSAVARGRDARSFIAGRVHRLLRPAVVTIAVIGVALWALTLFGVPADLIAVAGYRYGQPLWFLAVFLLCQALLPALVHLHRTRPLLILAGLVAAAAAVDAARAISGVDALGFLNLAFVWLALQQIGFFLADGSIDSLPRRTRARIGMGAALTLFLGFATGLCSPDLIAHINPPTSALILVGIVHTCALSLNRPRLSALSARPLAAAVSGFVGRRTMTIYLWHMPVLLAMAGVTAIVAISDGSTLPVAGSAAWWADRPLWLATALTLTALVAVPFTRIETRRPPMPTDATRRIALSVLSGLIGVVLLLVTGTTPVTAMIAVGLLVVALRLAAAPVHGRWIPWSALRSVRPRARA